MLPRVRPLDPAIAPDEVAAQRDVVLAQARRFQLSVYDACYLDLALRSGAVLASFDKKLLDAMRKAGGQIFE